MRCARNVDQNVACFMRRHQGRKAHVLLANSQEGFAISFGIGPFGDEAGDARARVGERFAAFKPEREGCFVDGVKAQPIRRLLVKDERRSSVKRRLRARAPVGRPVQQAKAQKPSAPP